eukprot:5199988-Amphidinium_carterae.1
MPDPKPRPLGKDEEMTVHDRVVRIMKGGADPCMTFDFNAEWWKVQKHMHLVADQGPKSWSGLTYMQHLGCRLTISGDLLHRLARDWDAGIGACGLRSLRTEFKSVVTLQQGPFKSGGHNCLLGETATALAEVDHP